jgi:hypothetical protein
LFVLSFIIIIIIISSSFLIDFLYLPNSQKVVCTNNIYIFYNNLNLPFSSKWRFRLVVSQCAQHVSYHPPLPKKNPFFQCPLVSSFSPNPKGVLKSCHNATITYSLLLVWTFIFHHTHWHKVDDINGYKFIYDDLSYHIFKYFIFKNSLILMGNKI